MCFLIENMSKGNKRPKPMVAKKDMTVYKAIRKNGYGKYYNLIIDNSYHPWERGYWYYIVGTPFKKLFGHPDMIGGECFYSYKTERLLRFNLYISRWEKIVTMIIPKGSLYYTNHDGVIVSDQIIFPHKK